MVVDNTLASGLARVEQVCADRTARARELHGQGKRIIGYLCCYAAPEFLTAAGLVPFRIMGDPKEPITRADEHLETNECPFLRSCFDLALKGNYDFLDGFICPHTCDNVTSLYEVWQHYTKPAYSFFVNVPHTRSEPSRRFFEAELGHFVTTLEQFTGSGLPVERLNAAINVYNEQRALVRALYDLRKPNPPLLLGTELAKTIVACVSLPAEEANELLRDVIAEVKRRRGVARPGPRILLYGSEMDDISFVEMVEECGANVVGDDLCLGLRPYRHDVATGDNPVASLANYYLDKITCPRTFDRLIDGGEEELANRFGHLRDLVQEYKADAVITYVMQYCDIFNFQLPDVTRYLASIGVPVLAVENDHSAANTGRLKVRVEAFVEMVKDD